jgi:hypothetical protein
MNSRTIFLVKFVHLKYFSIIRNIINSYPLLNKYKITSYLIAILAYPLAFPIILIIILFFFGLFIKSYVDTRKSNNIQLIMTRKYENNKYFIIFKSKKYDKFFNDQIVKYLKNDISVIWVDKNLYKKGQYSNNEIITDLLTLINTRIKNFNYPIYLSLGQNKCVIYNIRNLLMRYNKGRITIEELVHEINNFDTLYGNRPDVLELAKDKLYKKTLEN